MLSNASMSQSALSNATSLLSDAYNATVNSTLNGTDGTAGESLFNFIEPIKNASPSVVAGAVFLGLAVAGAAACLSRAQSGTSEANAAAPRLPDALSEDGDLAVYAPMPKINAGDDQSVRSDAPALPGTPSPSVSSESSASGAATPTTSGAVVKSPEPAVLAKQLTEQLSSISGHSAERSTGGQSRQTQVSLDTGERTVAAVALKNQGAHDSRLEAVNKPRAARDAALEAKQKAGVEGRKASMSLRNQLEQTREAELAARRAKVAAARGRRAAVQAPKDTSI